jgi:hypothetical protein
MAQRVEKPKIIGDHTSKTGFDPDLCQSRVEGDEDKKGGKEPAPQAPPAQRANHPEGWMQHAALALDPWQRCC